MIVFLHIIVLFGVCVCVLLPKFGLAVIWWQIVIFCHRNCVGYLYFVVCLYSSEQSDNLL